MEMLILKGIIYDLKDNFAEKLRVFLNKSPNAEWVADVCDYEDPAEEMDELRAELTSLADANEGLREELIGTKWDRDQYLHNNYLLRAENTELTTDRDKYFNLLSVVHDRNIFLESEILIKHRELSDLKESVGNVKMIIDSQEGWVADQYSKIENYVRENDIHIGYDAVEFDLYSHADIIIDDHAKLFVKLQTIKNLLG